MVAAWCKLSFRTYSTYRWAFKQMAADVITEIIEE